MNWRGYGRKRLWSVCKYCPCNRREVLRKTTRNLTQLNDEIYWITLVVIPACIMSVSCVHHECVVLASWVCRACILHTALCSRSYISCPKQEFYCISILTLNSAVVTICTNWLTSKYSTCYSHSVYVHVRAQVRSRGICGRQTDIADGISRSASVSPANSHSRNWSTFINHPFMDAVQPWRWQLNSIYIL
jgi:hypothetical protein